MLPKPCMMFMEKGFLWALFVMSFIRLLADLLTGRFASFFLILFFFVRFGCCFPVGCSSFSIMCYFSLPNIFSISVSNYDN